GPAAPAQAASDEPLPAGRRLEPGQYQIIGFVVAEVNGTPIYADRVLSLLKSPLAAEAKRNSPEMFRAFATRLIADKVNELKVNELEVAAATTGLAAEDKRVADLLTMQWRAQQITNAGGSPQLAKQKAEQNGEDWEDLVDRVYRAKLIEVFYRKRIVPLIAVSATDVRDYYARNVGKQFTEHGQATFRVIKIGRRPGESADAALARATKLQAQAAGDADFAQLAASDANDDKALRARGGLFENIQAGAFRLAEVDKKVWDTKPGDVTPVVQDQGGFYVAKVEAMTAGSVKPFESLEVQDGIRNLLWRQQFAKHRQAIQEDLIKKAVIRGSDADVAKVVDMAMQDYRRWAQL
ncbi:MAG TPA: peptidyl-prolyl cis-trans isomerase, partial [Tepidisphaeraceae bacterium]|nr:peptidyl-prolyl cis-trans isomerase [Tepidisphaeraceae bacterium]